MKFGTFPLDQVLGAVLAHSLRLPDDSVVKKGTVLTDDLIDLMYAASIEEVMVAIPEAGDLLEDDAASRIAGLFDLEGLRVDQARTGRVNFFATRNGIFRVSPARIDEINAADPGITFACLPDYAEVNEGRMVATVKIIPYTVPEDAINSIEQIDMTGAISVAPYGAKKIGLIFTQLPGTKPSILDKTRTILERRIALSGSQIICEMRVSHKIAELKDAIVKMHADVDLVVVFGASAISDVGDVIPEAVLQSGGEIIRFGMPVDPGNLLLLAELGNKPVIGAPGCARSPVENGFDWVLQRLLADQTVSSLDVVRMGVGGLLMETGARPHPRLKKPNESKKTAAIVLAAGQSRRMGDVNKMTVPFRDKPMVRHVVDAATSSLCDAVFVVTGHAASELSKVLDDASVELVENPQYRAGLSTSLRAGVAAVSGKYDRAIILLGDMPFVSTDMINQLVETSETNAGAIVLSCYDGKRGNPVVWPSVFFEELKRIEGDVGARHIIGANADVVVEVDLGEGVHIDLDTPEALALHAAANKN